MQHDHFHHEAFFYADDDELLAGLVPFLREGLDADEAMLVALPRRRLDLLQAELGPAAQGIRFADMEELGRNPARIIPVWREFLAANLAGRGARGIGEPIWAGRSAPELEECQRHEALLNLAFDDGPPWHLVCPYDTGSLDDEVLSCAERNHPVVSRPGERLRSASYVDPAAGEGPFAGELDVPAAAPPEFCFSLEQLSHARRFVAGEAEREGLAPARIADLVLAASEVAANGIRHGEGSASVRLWRENGSLVCDVSDRGRIAEPLAGRRHPRPDQLGGRGLWLANQLCDLVQIRSGEEGNLIRLWMSVED